MLEEGRHFKPDYICMKVFCSSLYVQMVLCLFSKSLLLVEYTEKQTAPQKVLFMSFHHGIFGTCL